MVEPLLSGIVLGLITVSAFGLFVAAFLQYQRGNQFETQFLLKLVPEKFHHKNDRLSNLK